MKHLTPPGSALDPVEHASRDEITALQIKRMRQTLRHAGQNVPHYRAAFAAAFAGADDIRVPQDIARFPFTTKADMRANYPFGMMAVPRDRLRRVHASSGTTGQPTVAGYTAGDLETWGLLMARSLRAAGARAGDVVHVAYGYGLFTGGFGAHAGAERLGCTVVPVSGGMTARQVRLIEDFGAAVICVTPSYLLAILDEYRAQGRDPRASPLRTSMLGGEPWTNAMRDEIETAFDMHGIECYGLSEAIGPGVAMECVETKDGPHLWEDHFWPEIIDPATGRVLPDGERGELVLTSLTKEAMPVIRYRTGDLTRLLPGTARPMRRIEKIAGRVDDMIILRGVNVFPGQIEELVLAEPGLAPHYQIELRREGRLDAMTVVAERLPGADGVTEAGLQRRIRQGLGLSVAVRLGPPGSVPRSEGKARRVLDLREG